MNFSTFAVSEMVACVLCQLISMGGCELYCLITPEHTRIFFLTLIPPWVPDICLTLLPSTGEEQQTQEGS